MSRHAVEIIRVQPGDIAEVLAVLTECHEQVVQSGRTAVPVALVGPRLSDAISSGQVEVILARWEGRAAGFVVLREALISFVEAQALCIDQFYVCPGERRGAVARSLLTYVAGRAERTGSEQVVADVPPWDRDTQRFFARLGFAPLTLRRSVSPAMLRRRLAGDAHQGGLESLLSYRRSLRARARREPRPEGLAG